jgi:DNA polymerase-3 subunit alpha
MNFTHLHNHSEYSLLDGMTTPEEMAMIAKSHGQFSCAITDHGTMSGTLRFQEACQKFGIKPIHGIEAYYVPEVEKDNQDKNAERFHLIVLAKNNQGLEKLFKVQQKAWTDNFYYKNRIEMSDIEYLAGDVVVLSGCMGGQLCKLLAADKVIEAQNLVMDFQTLLANDYYIEIQPWNEGNLNSQLISLAKELNIPMVGTLDCHYPTKNDAGYEEILLMMGQVPSLKLSAKTYAREHAEEAKSLTSIIDKMNIMYPERFLRFEHIQPYVMSTEIVEKTFHAAGLYDPALMDNTQIIADKCTSQIKTNIKLLPKFSDKYDSDWYLREIAELGLTQLELDGNEIYVKRLNYELGAIQRLKFSDYFLIVWDICAFANKQGIARGPGRGSVCGSLLAFVLGITKIDPIKHDLIFERFINEERINFPDIDLDFEDKRRGEIKNYTYEKWGEDHVASISTYGVFKPKSTIKSILSVYQMPFEEANKISPLFDTLEEFVVHPQTQKVIKEYPTLVPIAEKFSGRIKVNGAHASAVVISKDPLWKNLPIESRGIVGEDQRLKVIAFNGNEAETIGLWKFDFLGLKAVSVINDCLKKIKEVHGVDVEKISEAMDDLEVIQKFNTDILIGIFQAEGAGYTNLISEMGIDSLNDLIASTALVRPGAMNTQGKPYISRKKGNTEVEYPHECLEDILKETYGTVVYQEQLMKLAMSLCGFTMNEADGLRKIIGKKRDAKEFLPFYKKFISGAEEKVSPEVAKKLWEDLERTAEYMFNKSHSVGYSFLAYQTMWLKHYYPTEFIWSSLTNENKPEDVASFLVEAKRLGIGILPPDINLSDDNFTLESNSVRFGLGDINKAGPSAVTEIISKRPYHSYEEFINKVAKAKVKAPLIENLEKIGAFASCNFESGYDARRYFLEVLNCPIYVEDDKRFENLLTPLAEVPDTGKMCVVRGMVKAVKRTPKYFRVELEDSSGTKSFFADDISAPIKKRDFLICLAGDKSLIAFANPEEESPLINFLLNPPGISDEIFATFRDDYTSGVVVSSKWFKTKAGELMANTWIYGHREQAYKKWTMFNNTYSKYHSELTAFNNVVIRKGSKINVLDGLISVEEYAKLKGITSELLVSNQK